MRSVFIVCVACVVSGLTVAARVAEADDAKDVDAAIRAVFDGEQTWASTPDSAPEWPRKLAGAYVLGPSGAPAAAADLLEAELHQSAPSPLGRLWWKLGAPTLSVDAAHGFAWFQASAALDLDFMWPGPANPRASDTLRVSGVLVLGKDKRWQFAAVAFSRQLLDAALFRGASASVTDDDPVQSGDSGLARQVTDWLRTRGLARAQASGASVASGTAPSELATGAAAGKLAAAWDKLGMKVKAVEAKTYAGGAIGIARAEVQLPVKKRAAPMVLCAIAVSDGARWKWVSLQFTTELAKPPIPQQPSSDGI